MSDVVEQAWAVPGFRGDGSPRVGLADLSGECG